MEAPDAPCPVEEPRIVRKSDAPPDLVTTEGSESEGKGVRLDSPDIVADSVWAALLDASAENVSELSLLALEASESLDTKEPVIEAMPGPVEG